ncbi:MAG: NUDIX hydrolase [Gammaproteobacteria bacterium]|nr:MAG: NUDIX hydrolase [Gammaproteobacteria bacterium]
MKKSWPGRRPLHAGRVVDLGLEPVTLPDGTRLELEVVRHPGGAAVVALDAHDRVCLLRQWRHAAGGWLWELPAGRLEPGEPPLETARRELEEEAGLQAGHWDPLGRILTTPGFCDELIHLFLARELRPVPQRLEHHECLEVHWIPVREAEAWVRTGRIRDAKTLAGLCLARAWSPVVPAGEDTP